MRLSKQDTDLIALALAELHRESQVTEPGKSLLDLTARLMLGARAGFLSAVFFDAKAATVKEGEGQQ